MTLAPRRLAIELSGACNLHCSYCVRDADTLYSVPAQFLDVGLLARVLREARREWNAESVAFTGGEPLLHPRFGEIVETVAASGWRFGIVTNGWHFERWLPPLLRHQAAIEQIAFSLDGTSREPHDGWRGRGSFDRVVKAIALCHARSIPLGIKVVLRRDTVAHMEAFVSFAARLGADGVAFTHLLPTSAAISCEHGLSPDERRRAEDEVGALARIFKIRVTMGATHRNLDPAPPCDPLSGKVCNVDHLGRLTLCCNLSGYRGAAGTLDVVADLRTESLVEALPGLKRVASAQLERRRLALRADPDQAAFPCHFCLASFAKAPWLTPEAEPSLAEAIAR